MNHSKSKPKFNMNNKPTVTESQNLPQQFNQYSNSTIQRCPHDAENPYAQISRALIRDQSISPNCRWLIIYLLSNKDGWKISTAQVAKHVKEFLGRDNVWKIFDEAIEAGYILREEIKNGNLKNGYRYYVSESPKFKKCFRHTESQCTEAQCTENTEHKEEYSSKNEQKKYIPSANAERLKDFLVNIIKKDKPNFSASTNSWPKIFDDLLKVRTYEQICEVIEYMLMHDFWKSNVVSPASIKKNLDRIEIQMQSTPKTSIQEIPYEKVSKHFKHGELYNGAECFLTKDSLAFQRGTRNEGIKLDQYFSWQKVEALCKSFQIPFSRKL